MIVLCVLFGLLFVQPMVTVAELGIIGNLGIGPCMDVAIDDENLYAIGRGHLYAIDLTVASSPKVVGSVTGLGNVRQICVRNGMAFVTAREDGLFLVDVTKPRQPKLVAHYDTIELATGIAVGGDVAFVACRTAGVELIDVSDPTKPRHLSTVRTGEAQSVDYRDGLLYVGVWATRELVICNVSNPYKPSVIARAALDGYGDGVCVRDTYCYVATGHHSRAIPREEPGDAGYGRGHGLEIFDIADPRHPRFVARVKFPALYRLGMDMWSVTVSSDRAFVADTYNGVFVVDVSEPSKPKITAHCPLPHVPQRDDPSPVAGLAVGQGMVFAAGAWSDLHLIKAPMARPVKRVLQPGPTIPPAPEPCKDPRFLVYRPAGQVHAVAFDANVAFVAAGMSGVHSVAINSQMRRIAQYAVDGCAFGVAAWNGMVYVAAGTGGLSIWEHLGDGRLVERGHYRVPGQSIRQVIVPPPGRFSLLHVGSNTLHLVNVHDPQNPTLQLRDSHVGLFYNAPLPTGLLDQRYTCCHWHVSGLYWYDLAGKTPKPTGDHFPFRIGSRNGVAFLKNQALVTCRGGYVLMPRNETRSLDELRIVRVAGKQLSGKPTVDGTTLYLSDRYTGRVTAVDISNPTRPRLLDQVSLTEHPGIVVVHDGTPVIPGGYNGLLVWLFESPNSGEESSLSTFH